VYFVAVLTGVLLFSPHPGIAKEKVLPFFVGEEIEYSFRWEMISAGSANFKVMPYTSLNGEKAYHFLLVVKSNRFIDKLYKMRARLEGFTDSEFTQSLLYKKIETGKSKKDVLVQFDWKNKTATYSNFGGKRDPIKIPNATFDPVSSFYKMRAIDLESDQNLSFSVTDGKKSFTQKGSVIKKETLTLPSGTFETYVLLPQIKHFSGVFKKSKNPNVRVWITADEKKIPVRIKVKVFIGSFIFDLVSIK